MKDDRNEPAWVTPFFYAAAMAAILALSAALLYGGGGDPTGHGRRIADITLDLNGVPVREHCTTCHVQGGLPNVEALGVYQEYHPDIEPHSPEKLGCTACHLGEGMALDPKISHGLPGLEARRVLTGEEVQARCYVCHELTPLSGAERAWSGYELFRTRACDTCHRITPGNIGGRFGPDLETIGSYLGLKQLTQAIRKPKREPPNSIMPRFPLSRNQSRDLALFLKSRVTNPLHSSPMDLLVGRLDLPPVPMPGAAGLPAEGRLLASRKCLACHKFGEADGRIAPDLTPIGAMREREYLSIFLKDPAEKIPGAIMPPVGLTPLERENIVKFLSEQATNPTSSIGAQGSGKASSSAPEVRTHNGSKHAYMSLCQRCHAASGDGHGLIQPNLANFPRPFAGNSVFFERVPDDRLIRSIEKGIPGTSMPPYDKLLDREETEALLDLIFEAFVGIPRTAKAALPQLPRAPGAAFRQGEAKDLYMENCSRCHGRYGTGKGPEYLEFLPRPRDLTNAPYFASVADDRIARAIADGIPGTAMPSFRNILSPAELWSLVGEVRRFSRGGESE